MAPTRKVACRVDFRSIKATHFCEYIGRTEYVSATGCTTTERPEPGTALELRLYAPGGAWPIRVTRATVAWAHWDEFTVEFEDVPLQDLDQLQRSLNEASLLAAA